MHDLSSHAGILLCVGEKLGFDRFFVIRNVYLHSKYVSNDI